MSKKCLQKSLTIQQFNELLESLDFVADLNIKRNGCNIAIEHMDCIYNCSLTGDNRDAPNCGNIAAQLNKYAPDFAIPEELKAKYGYKRVSDKVKWDLIDPGNFSYINEDYAGTPLNIFSYDVNSAYDYALLQDMPDVTVEAKYGAIIGKNEIGFYKNGGVSLDEGDYADYVFPLRKSPYIDFVNRYYEKKQNSKDKLERSNWKQFLVVVCGLIAKRNIFDRLAMLYYSRTYINKFIDENTVYCNVDSIYSLEKRDDIPLGNDIGLFKLEKQNIKFIFKAEGIYQVEDECHYKGIPGKTINDIYNINGWINRLPYKYDSNKRRIVENA